ncbi:MAG: hypothetical protein K5780_01280 [Alphaproteobacteria bacterium]|nr:hypothetical protein [Alphaproteobacteria bacterium]
MLETFGDRNCCVCRELTKLYEEFKRGKVSEVVQYFSENTPKGEFVVVVSGKKEESINEDEIFLELSELLKTVRVKEAVSIIVDKYSINKKIVYQKALELKGK